MDINLTKIAILILVTISLSILHFIVLVHKYCTIKKIKLNLKLKFNVFHSLTIYAKKWVKNKNNKQQFMYKNTFKNKYC